MSSSEDEQAITIRRLGDEDGYEVVRLALRDSRPVPEGELLGAESQGRLRAVISLTTGAAVADPFARTEEIMELLRGRLAHLRRRDAYSRNGRGFGSSASIADSDMSAETRGVLRGEARPVNESLDEARRYVRRKRIFYTVLGVWIALSLMWFAIDMLDDSSSIWFYWPMLGTGIGVAITGIVLLGIGGLFGADWERRQIEKYQRRRRGEPGG